jgi:hypothetical protein
MMAQFEKGDSYQGIASAMPLQGAKRCGFSRWGSWRKGSCGMPEGMP